MKAKSVLLFGTLIFTFLSCKKKEEVKDPWEFDIDKVAIQDTVKLLMILTDQDRPLNDNTKENQLYMITSSDKVLEKTLNKTTGESVSDIMKPGAIENASPTHMLMTFSRADALASEGYLIDKKTGQMTLLGDSYNNPSYMEFATLKNHLISKYDGSRCLYYVSRPPSYSDQIIQFDLNTMTKKVLNTDTVKRVTSFDVDKNGNIMADIDGISGKRWMIAFNVNTLQKLQTVSLAYWVANDGMFRNSSNNRIIEKIGYETANKKFTVSEEINLQTLSISNQFLRSESYLAYYSDKTIILSKNEIFELLPVEKKIKQITSVPLISTKWVDHSKALGHLYVAGESATGQETIFNIDLSNYSYKTYPEAGKYTFYEIEAFEDGTIYATAKRKSDSKNVILKFAPDGTETVLYDQLGTKKGVWLEKVTEFVND